MCAYLNFRIFLRIMLVLILYLSYKNFSSERSTGIGLAYLAPLLFSLSCSLKMIIRLFCLQYSKLIQVLVWFLIVEWMVRILDVMIDKTILKRSVSIQIH